MRSTGARSGASYALDEDLNLKVNSAPCAHSDARGVIAGGRPGTRRILATTALALTLALLWTLTHQYEGLTRDGHIYAFQAFARLHPALRTDIYLANTSQDRFTVFSPLYAAAIRALGLYQAGALMLGICAAWFLTAAWFFARAVLDEDFAWLSVAMLILTVGRYGSYEIFHFSEDYLTARSLAEALVMTALACEFCGRRAAGLLAGAAAMLVHPLMAFPGLLMLFCSWASLRWNLIGAAAGIAAALLLAGGAMLAQAAAGPFAVLDPAWLEVVRERSQFLFPQLWRLHDWDLNARPFLTTALAAWVFADDARVRKLCLGALLVGATGLAVAWIAGFVGPVAILLQGQAWRWVWITSLVGVILLPGTCLRMWREGRSGPFAAILAVLAWTLASVDGTATLAAALVLWSLRDRVGHALGSYLRWAAFALIAIVVVWVLGNSWTYASWNVDFRSAPMLIQRARNILGLAIPAVLLVGLVWYAILRTRGRWLAPAIAAGFAALLAATLPYAFHSARFVHFAAAPDGFADWRAAIPPAASVYVDDGGDSPVFAWFTLERPSYLSVDQSAGVVFSRKTALEIRRRADVLRPLMPPDYAILSKRAEARRTPASARKKSEWPRPLTARMLTSVCRDPALGFLVARQFVGFGAMRHSRRDSWNGWYLYDCRRVRAAGPAA